MYSKQSVISSVYDMIKFGEISVSYFSVIYMVTYLPDVNILPLTEPNVDMATKRGINQGTAGNTVSAHVYSTMCKNVKTLKFNIYFHIYK